METGEEMRRFTQTLLAIAGRLPVGIQYDKPPECPVCGDHLWLRSVRPHWFPYVHVDYALRCPTCTPGFHLYGVPMSKDAGLSLILMDSNPLGVLKGLLKETLPECPYGHGDKTPTKVLGDWLRDTFQEQIVYQWKCRICYHITHKLADRPAEHRYDSTSNPLSEEEQAILTERLRKLGYIE